MRGALAVAWITVLAVARRGVFWLIAAQAAVVGVAALMVPVTAQVQHAARLRMILFAGGECALLLATLVAAFGAATAIPSDTVSKRLYLVLTKPCSRAGLVVGRFLGYSAALLLLHVVWLLVIVAAVVGLQLRGDIRPEQTTVRAPVRAVQVDVEGDTATIHHTNTDGEEEEECHEGHNHPPISVAPEDPRARVWVLSGAGDTAVFHFEGLSLNPEDTGAELELDFGGEFKKGKGPLRSSEIAVSMASPEGEWTTPHVDRLRYRKPFLLPLDPTLVVDGRLRVKIERNDGRFDVYLRADRASVREPRGSLIDNLARTMTLLWLRSVLVVAMAVMASAFFPGPVAVLFAFFLTLLAQIIGFLERYARTVLEAARMVAELGADALKGVEHDGHSHGGFDAPSEAAVALARMCENTSWILPHFDEFDRRADLVRGLRVPLSQLVESGSATVIYSAAILTVAVLVFQRRSVA